MTTKLGVLSDKRKKVRSGHVPINLMYTQVNGKNVGYHIREITNLNNGTNLIFK